MLIDQLLETGAQRATVFTTADGKVHDRSKTVGGSESYSCIRKQWFDKHDAPPDPHHSPNWGFFQRGHAVEEWLVGLIRESGADLRYAGDDQRTLVNGRLAATPDGLLVTENGEEVVVEIKSLDPRSNLDSPKLAHVHQANLQMGLFKAVTDHDPDHAILLYVDASDYSHIVEHRVDYDPGRYEEAQRRAERVFATDDPASLMAEGSLDGTCRYCPYTEACGEAVLTNFPSNTDHSLDPDELSLIKSLVMRHDVADSEIRELTADKKKYAEQLKIELRKHDLKKVVGEDWEVTYSQVSGRSTLDKKAVEAAGIDLEPYYKRGKDSDRLTVKVRHGE